MFIVIAFKSTDLYWSRRYLTFVTVSRSDNVRGRSCNKKDEISGTGILEIEIIISVMHSLRKADTTIKETHNGAIVTVCPFHHISMKLCIQSIPDIFQPNSSSFT